jgi:hypothetical protein
MRIFKLIWAREPVLVSTVVPLLVTAGVLTTDQASVLQNGIAGAVAAVVEVVAAFVARSRVSPVVKRIPPADVTPPAAA